MLDEVLVRCQAVYRPPSQGLPCEAVVVSSARWKGVEAEREVTCGAPRGMAVTRSPILHSPVPPPLAGHSPLPVDCPVTWPCSNQCSGGRVPQPRRVWGAPAPCAHEESGGVPVATSSSLPLVASQGWGHARCALGHLWQTERPL